MQHVCAHDRLRVCRGTGFTMIDLILVLAVLAIVTMLALPSVESDQPLKLVGASTILASDFEFAQSETLAVPADPTEVHIDSTNGHYWLARKSAPTTPIDRPDITTTGSGVPYEVWYGQGDEGYLAGVQIEIIGVGSGVIAYDAFGRLEQSNDARVKIYNDSGDLFVVVTASTGSVSIEE